MNPMLRRSCGTELLYAGRTSMQENLWKTIQSTYLPDTNSFLYAKTNKKAGRNKA